VIDMSPEAVERRLCALSEVSGLVLEVFPRVDMSPAAIDARIAEWAELTALCLDLAASPPRR
jgi:hypothetical protein